MIADDRDREEREDLVDVTPYTARGERGMIHILERANAEAWVRDHAAELLEEGYARVTITDHVFTRIVGDRRRRRSPAPLGAETSR